MKQQKPRLITLTMVFTIMLSALIMVTGCGGDKAGSGGGDADLFALLPAEVSGAFMLNVKKASTMDFFDNMIEKLKKETPDEKAGRLFKNYQDFVDKTGIDPKKDVHGIAVGLYGALNPSIMGSGPETVVVLNIDYDKDKVIGFIKGQGGDFTSETYNGVTCFRVTEAGKDQLFAFVDNHFMVGGVVEAVKKAIDLSKGTGKSIKDNPALSKHLDRVDTGAVIAFLLALPEDVKKVHDTGMVKMDLSQAEALIGSANYENKNWEITVKMISPNEEANEQLVNTLNGLKMLGAAMGKEAAEVVNNITFSYTADAVKLSVVISQELVEKLQSKASSATKGHIGPPVPEPDESEAQSEEKK